MKIQLIDDNEQKREFWISLDAAAEDALRLQWERIQDDDASKFAMRFQCLFSACLVGSLDADIEPPTFAQLKYAVAIAKELGVSVPADALLLRREMTLFISQLVDQFKARCG